MFWHKRREEASPSQLVRPAKTVVIITAQATGEYNRSQCSEGTSTF